VVFLKINKYINALSCHCGIYTSGRGKTYSNELLRSAAAAAVCVFQLLYCKHFDRKTAKPVTMLFFATAAAIGTFAYALLLPSVSPCALLVAAACCTVALAVYGVAATDVPTLTFIDVQDGVVLFVVFAGYQYALREALKQSSLSLAVVNANICLLALHSIVRSGDYASAPPLLSACMMYSLLGIYIAYFAAAGEKSEHTAT